MKYISRAMNYRLIIEPQKNIIINGTVVMQDETSIAFQNGVFKTESPEEIAFLRSHPSFGREFFEVNEAQELQRRKQQIQIELEQIEKQQNGLNATEAAPVETAMKPVEEPDADAAGEQSEKTES